MQDLPPGDDRSVMFLQRLERTTFLREDAQEGFLRVLVELAVTHCLGSEKKNQGGEESSMSFAAVDAVLSFSHASRETPGRITAATFGALWTRVGRHRSHGDARHGRARSAVQSETILSSVERLTQRNAPPDAVLDSSHPQVLAAFASVLLALQPMRVPGFAFAWLELVSHRCFMPRLLLDHARKGRPLLQRLICAAEISGTVLARV